MSVKFKRAVKKVSFYIVFILLLFLFTEVFSYAVMSAYNLIIQGNSFAEIMEKRRDDIEILKMNQKGKQQYFDPITQSRLPPNERYQYLEVNEHGFIKNAHTDSLLDVFPEKPQNFYRIILIGGSTTAGAEIDTKDTIATQLENILNEKKPNENYIYQVLNFGMGSANSGSNLVRFFQQIMYYEPDMIISLEGYNDFYSTKMFYLSVIPFDSYRLKHSIINWQDFSYHHFNAMNGFIQENSKLFSKLLPRSYSLIKKIERRILFDPKKKLKAYEDLPFYRHSELIQKNFPNGENALYNNLDVFASYFSQNQNTKSIFYLQPHAYEYKNLTDFEKTTIKNRFTCPKCMREETYANLISSAFKSYEKVYSDLNKKYENYSNIKFINIMNLFKDHKEGIYDVDPIHYNAEGARLIAERYYDDIKNII